MNNLHENQRRILDFLLDHPQGASLEEIAAHLGITKTGAREHVVKIAQLGLLAYTDTPGSVGRPRRKYSLSPAGQEALPKQYSWLSNVLLEFLSEDLGPSGVNRIMKALASKVAGSMKEKFDAATGTADRLRLISETMNELGYRSSLRQSDVRKGAVLEATNCVYHALAKEHPELCQFDIQFLKSTSGLEVKLEKCIAKGDSVCRFCLKKSAP